MMTSTDLKTAAQESLREVDAPDSEPLAPIEMGPADRETKGGFWGFPDCHASYSQSPC